MLVPLLGDLGLSNVLAYVQGELLPLQHGVFDLCGQEDLWEGFLVGLESEVAFVLLLLFLLAWLLGVSLLGPGCLGTFWPL